MVRKLYIHNMKKITSLLILSLFSASFAFAAESNPLKSVSVSYNKNNVPTVLVQSNRASMTPFKTDGVQESAILAELALQHDMSIRSVTKITKFSYSKLDRKDSAINVKAAKITTTVKNGKTIITVTYKGKTDDYWFNTGNSYKAAKEFSKIYGLPTAQVWKNIKINR